MLRMSKKLIVLVIILLSYVLVSAQNNKKNSGELNMNSTKYIKKSSDSSSYNWLHFGFDGQYTAYNPYDTVITTDNISQLERIWGIGCDDGYFSVISRSPAIFNGKLYTSGAGSKLTAYNAKTGDYLWEFGEGNHAWAPQPVVSEDSIVFYMEKSYPTYLYAIDAESGNKIWKAPIGFQVGYTDKILVTVDKENNVVYVVEDKFGGDEGNLFALNKQSGEVAWYMSKALDTLEFKGDYVLLKDGRIYARAGVGEQYSAPEHMISIRADSHEVELIYNRPEPDHYYDIKQYAICNDKLIVGYDYQYDPDKLLVAYDVSGPDTLWQKQITEITGTIACNTSKNIIYVPTNPYLYAIDASNGEEIWKYEGFGAIYNPSIANDIIYFISDNNMYALNEDNGDKIFHYDLGHICYKTSQVAICDGMLYFSGNGGTCDLYSLGFGATRINNDNETYHPKTFRLYQNYPNPFNPSTIFRFNIAKSCYVTLNIYNILGEEIETLVDGYRQTGVYEISWAPNNLANGIYFYQINAGEFRETRKFILQK
jgi:outer membrane protein assembly factor BamB